jgi:adenylate kinase family enzyme
MLGQRILVLGCSGSGKSTFARRLGALMDLPVVHLDRLYLKPGWAMPAREDFDSLLQDALSEDTWIMDGNYGRTLPLRLRYCALVIYFHLPRHIPVGLY